MQMIDVLKRLAELDAMKESAVNECGPMGIMPAEQQHHTPASVNITADSGAELSDMLKTIMSLAGLEKVGPEHLGVEHEPMQLTPEPGVAVGPAVAEPLGAVDSMKAVLDKLHPEHDGEELGAFQHDSEEPETGNDAADEEDDKEETDEGNAFGQAVQNTAPGEEIKIHGKGTGEIKKAEETYDNTPADPRDTPEFDSNEFANQENQSGSGDDEHGKKRTMAQPSATYESLMQAYKQFIGESSDEMHEGTCSSCHKDPCECDDKSEEGQKEGVEDRLKDLDPKNPVNIPAYQRKAKSGDSAAAVKREGVEETFDILKLAGLK